MFIGVVGGMLRFMSVPEITFAGVIYIVSFGIVGYLLSKLIGRISQYQNYEVSDTEYDKNIK